MDIFFFGLLMLSLGWTIAATTNPIAAHIKTLARAQIFVSGLIISMVFLIAFIIAIPKEAPVQPSHEVGTLPILFLLFCFIMMIYLPVHALWRLRGQAKYSPISTQGREGWLVKPLWMEPSAQASVKLTIRTQAAPARRERSFFDDLHPKAVSSLAVGFEYEDSNGDYSSRTVDVDQVGDEHFAGWCHLRNGERTFRFDRVLGQLKIIQTGEKLVPEDLQARLYGRSPQKAKARPLMPASDSMEVLFTGFTKEDRALLEDMARSHGLVVRKSMTKGLDILCAGPRAGPSKLAAAEEQGVIVLTELELEDMLQTGELPD